MDLSVRKVSPIKVFASTPKYIFIIIMHRENSVCVKVAAHRVYSHVICGKQNFAVRAGLPLASTQSHFLVVLSS